jgi:hypothetical protein
MNHIFYDAVIGMLWTLFVHVYLLGKIAWDNLTQSMEQGIDKQSALRRMNDK